MDSLTLRRGSRPTTTTRIPHSQTDQQPADNRYLTAILDEGGSWPGVHDGESRISVEGSRALVLAEDVAAGPHEAFIVGREFCHGHAQGDHSLHLTLPVDLVPEVEAAGWTEPHFLVLTGRLPRTHVMLYAPRDESEVAVALAIVRASYDFARGSTAAVPTTSIGAQRS